MTAETLHPHQNPATVLLAALVDDAGLFPPTQLPLAEAVARHRGDQQRQHPMHSHTFLCPSSRWAELHSALHDTDRFHVGVILDEDTAGLPTPVAEPGPSDPLRIAHVEARVEPDDIGKAARFLRGANPETTRPVYLELNRGPGWQRSIAQLHDAHPLGLKIRCGGPSAELFPDPVEVAEFLELAVTHRVPIKATAGLHNAVRHRDATTGHLHYGYLNLVAAVVATVSGSDRDTVLTALTETDAADLVSQLRTTEPHTARRARAMFRSYGSCDTAQPVRDAANLGLMH